MDPLSITTGAVSLAGVAWKLFNELKTFIQDYKDVDQNIHDLLSGVKQVQDVCLLIEKCVKLLPQSESEDLENEELFIGIETQLSGCAAIIHKVNSKIEKVRGTGLNAISRTYRSIMLNMSKEDISQCKNDIQVGVLNLQLMLQLVNLQATYIAPQLANRTLLEKLEDIQKLLAAQSVDKRVQDCADTYLSRGASLYEKSVASVAGFQNQSRPKAIAEWLEQLDALRLDESASPSLPPNDDLYSSHSQSLDTRETAATSLSNNDPKLSISQPTDPNDEGDEDDEEFAMEMVQVALDSGRVAYQDADYQDAENRLGECLALIRELPERRRRGYDIQEIHLLLALCAFHLHESATAEAALVSALDCNTGMSTQTELHYSAGSALAVVYIRLKKYEPARFTCENVYKGRRRLLGKENDRCLESLALLAVIHELQELPARAKTCRDMIPKDKQPALNEMFGQLAQIKTVQAVEPRGSEVATPVLDNTVEDSSDVRIELGIPGPKLQRPSASPLRDLPPEQAEQILLHILQNLDNLKDLFSVARASKGFYRTFKRNELRLLKNVIWKMSPAPVGAELDNETQIKPTQVLAEAKQNTKSQQENVTVDETWMLLDLRFYTLTISTTSKMLAYSSKEPTRYRPAIGLRRLNSSLEIRRINNTKEGPATTLEFDGQGERLFSGHGGGPWHPGIFRSHKYPLSIRVWNVADGQCLHVYPVSGTQDNLTITTLRYSRNDERLFFTYRFSNSASIKSKTDAKLKPGFAVLKAATGSVVYQEDYGICNIRNFSEDFSMVSLQMNQKVKTYEITAYSMVTAEESHRKFNIYDEDVCSLYRSDGSLLSLSPNGNIYKTVDNKGPEFWVNVLLPVSFNKIGHAWMGLSPKGHLVIIFATIAMQSWQSLYIAVPELGLCKEIKSGSGLGDIGSLTDIQGTPIWAVSEDARYLAYVVGDAFRGYIQVLDIEKQLKQNSGP